MIDEINVHEKRGFLICEAAFQTKEAAIKRPVACVTDSCDQIGPVVGPESPDFNPAFIAQRLYRGIFFDFRHVTCLAFTDIGTTIPKAKRRLDRSKSTSGLMLFDPRKVRLLGDSGSTTPDEDYRGANG